MTMTKKLKKAIGCFLIMSIALISIDFTVVDAAAAENGGAYLKSYIEQQKKDKESTDKFEVNESEKIP